MDQILRGRRTHLISSAITRANKLFARGVFDVLSVLFLQPADVTDSPLIYPGIFLLALLAQNTKQPLFPLNKYLNVALLLLTEGSRSIT